MVPVINADNVNQSAAFRNVKVLKPFDRTPRAHESNYFFACTGIRTPNLAFR